MRNFRELSRGTPEHCPKSMAHGRSRTGEVETNHRTDLDVSPRHHEDLTRRKAQAQVMWIP
jgi:hypothetical protein